MYEHECLIIIKYGKWSSIEHDLLSNIRSKDIVALSEEDILPDPSTILAEATNVGDNFVHSKLVEIQVEAKVVGGIW